MKLKWIVLGAGILLTACGQETENEEVSEQNEAATQIETAEEDQIASVSLQEEVSSFMHIHGISYDPQQADHLYVGTHHGLFQINSDNEWHWVAEEAERHDLMGFTFLDEETMVSSGHPAADSELENPIGVVTSADRGETWEPIALHGEVDFHVLEVNAGNSDFLYGVDAETQAFYRSEDGGTTWDTVEWNGLPEGEVTVYAMVSDPEDPSSILIGLPQGIFASADGGESWELAQEGSTLAIGEGNEHEDGTITAYLLGETAGLMQSEDFGETWEPLHFNLEQEDAVMQLAVHPEDADIITVGTSQEHLYQTEDGGETWTQIAEAGEPVS